MSRTYRTLPLLSKQSIERFWGYVTIKTEDECWEWSGGKTGKYGAFNVKYENGWNTARANRVAYMLTTGVDPKEMFVCHHCDNPPCCNPVHLFLGTHPDNVDDAKSKNRYSSGENHGMRLHPERRATGQDHGSRTHPERVVRGEQSPSSKITEKQVQQVRQLRKEGTEVKVLVRMFNVSAGHVRRLINGTRWKHVT